MQVGMYMIDIASRRESNIMCIARSLMVLEERQQMKTINILPIRLVTEMVMMYTMIGLIHATTSIIMSTGRVLREDKHQRLQMDIVNKLPRQITEMLVVPTMIDPIHETTVIMMIIGRTTLEDKLPTIMMGLVEQLVEAAVPTMIDPNHEMTGTTQVTMTTMTIMKDLLPEEVAAHLDW